MGNIVREKGRLGRRGLGLVALLGGLGVAGVVAAPAASAAVIYGTVTTSAYFSTLSNAQNYSYSPPAGAQTQALANCRVMFPLTASVSYAGGAVSAGTAGYYGNVEWSCIS